MEFASCMATSRFWKSRTSKVLIFGFARQKAGLLIHEDIFTVLLPYLWEFIISSLIPKVSSSVADIQLNLPIKHILKPRVKFRTVSIVPGWSFIDRYSVFSTSNGKSISRFNAKMIHDCDYVLHIGLVKMNKSFKFCMFEKLTCQELVEDVGFQMYYVASVKHVVKRVYFNYTKYKKFLNRTSLDKCVLSKDDIISIVVNNKNRKLHFELNNHIISNATADFECTENDRLYFIVGCVGMPVMPHNVCKQACVLDLFPS